MIKNHNQHTPIMTTEGNKKKISMWKNILTTGHATTVDKEDIYNTTAMNKRATNINSPTPEEEQGEPHTIDNQTEASAKYAKNTDMKGATAGLKEGL